MTKNNNNNELYKYYYEYWEYADWDNNKLLNITTPELSISQIRKCAKTYATNVLNFSQDEFYKKIARARVCRTRSITMSDKYFIAFEKLSDASSESDIKDILSREDISIKELKKFIKQYINIYRKNEKTSILDDLKNKIESFEEKQTKVVPKDDGDVASLSNAKAYIGAYVNNSKINKATFCQLNGITSDTFDGYVNIVRTFDHSLYDQLIEKIEDTRKKEKRKLIKKIPTIIENINDKDNSFNVLDYFLITTISLEEFKDICLDLKNKERMSAKDYKTIERFIANIHITPCNNKEINNLLKEDIAFNAKFDEKGNFIPDSTIKPSLEEKETVIEFLKLNGIPIDKKIYHLALKRYIDENINTKGNQKK